MEWTQSGFSMFSRAYNFFRQKCSGIAGASALGAAAVFGAGAADARAQDADIDLNELVDKVLDAQPEKDENAKKLDIKSENQRQFAEVYNEMLEESKKEKENGYFIEGRASGSSNRETGYDSWRTSLEAGKLAWPGSKWNGRVKVTYDDTDGREERFEFSGIGDYKFNEDLTAGFKIFAGDHGYGGEGRARITIDMGDALTGMLYARAGGSYDEDRIQDLEETGLLDSDQTLQKGYTELGLKLSTKSGFYLSIADVFNWFNSKLEPNTASSVNSDLDLETNAFIASLGFRKDEYSLDLTGIWTHTRTKDNLAASGSVTEDDMYRAQATGFYHFRQDGHSIGLMLGMDNNGWDVRGIYVFQKGRNDLAKEIDRLKTEKEEITRQEIMDRLEALSSVSLLVHKVEAGGRRTEMDGLRGWEAFANYQLTLSMSKSLVQQLRFSFEGTYGELDPEYGSYQKYVRGGLGAEARFKKGFYAFGELNGTSYGDKLPSWNASAGVGKRF